MISTGYVAAYDESDIHYTRFGRGKKKVFLIHGFFGFREIWLPLMLQLADKMFSHQFILPDMRGHGLSEMKTKLPENYFFDLGKDLNALIEKESDPGEKIILVGYSMGVLASLAYIEQFGEGKIDRLLLIDHALDWKLCRVFTHDHDEFFTLLSPVVDMIASDVVKMTKTHVSLLPKPEELAVRRLFEIIASSGITGVLSRFASSAHHPFFRSLAVKAIFVASEAPLRWAAYTIIGNTYTHQTHDYASTAKKLTIPTMFMLGTAGCLFDPTHYYNHVRQAMSEAEIIKFSKSGHDLMVVEPIKFLKFFRKFVF